MCDFSGFCLLTPEKKSETIQKDLRYWNYSSLYSFSMVLHLMNNFKLSCALIPENLVSSNVWFFRVLIELKEYKAKRVYILR